MSRTLFGPCWLACQRSRLDMSAVTSHYAQIQLDISLVSDHRSSVHFHMRHNRDDFPLAPGFVRTFSARSLSSCRRGTLLSLNHYTFCSPWREIQSTHRRHIVFETQSDHRNNTQLRKRDTCYRCFSCPNTPHHHMPLHVCAVSLPQSYPPPLDSTTWRQVVSTRCRSHNRSGNHARQVRHRLE